MSSSEVLIQAIFKCLAIRAETGIQDLRGTFAAFIKDGPEKFRQELQLFYEEVIEEADRLEKKSSQGTSEKDYDSTIINEVDEPQQIIDALRAKVADLSRKLEAKRR